VTGDYFKESLLALSNKNELLNKTMSSFTAPTRDLIQGLLGCGRLILMTIALPLGAATDVNASSEEDVRLWLPWTRSIKPQLNRTMLLQWIRF
jgi:hypothetical protein